jgi:mannan endo-1,4-beta-mannosidase
MSSDLCAAFVQRVDALVAEIHAVEAAMPKPPLPPEERAYYEHKLWELNRARINAVAALDRCRSNPPPTLYVNGATLCDRTGAAIILRGINLPLLDDWRFPGADNLDAVAQTGANAVRIAWYVNYPDADRPPYGISDLDGVLSRCKAAGMIPIVELGDLTGEPDPSLLNTDLILWWTSAPVVSVLNSHADCLIINLANELGYYHFAADPDAAKTAYISAYTTALQSIRAAGLAMPVMIDAPDFGTSLDFFVDAGPSLLAADPGMNLLLSAHAYWAATNYTGSIASCMALGLPLVFGEIANKEDDTDAGGTLIGYYDLDGGTANPAPSQFDYHVLLPQLGEDAVGWLAWGWGPDECAARQLSSDGTFAALTPYGEDIVDNPVYGVSLAVKATIPT